MRVAIVHDYLIQDGGAERVVLAMHELWPDAPIYTLFHDPRTTHPGFKRAHIIPSSLNALPWAKSHYEWYLPLMPQAVEQWDFTGFDVVISSASTFTKGIIVPPTTLHVSYIHTPTRFLWNERIGYVSELPRSGFVKRILPFALHRLRQWDVLAAARPDLILTNSATSAARIRRFYRRDATVLHPPVDTETITPKGLPGVFWLAGGRLKPYKRFDLLVEAFRGTDLPLVIFGDGPERARLQARATSNIRFVGNIDDIAKSELFARAIGYLFPQIEDFGITAVEAMAAGKPVIAFRAGGAEETIKHLETGLFIDMQTPEAFRAAVHQFDPTRFSANTIRSHAETFSKARFHEALRTQVEAAWKQFVCTGS